MKILYLYSKLIPYQIPVFNELVSKYNAIIHVVYDDHEGNSPYIPPNISGVNYYKLSEFSRNELLEFSLKLNPQIVFVSAWQVKKYLPIVKKLKIKEIPIIAGFDDNWFNTGRQFLGRLIFPYFLKNYFNYAWISGLRQYEYVKRLGFKENNILYYLYSCDSELFNSNNYLENQNINCGDNKKYFLFIGRHIHIKGIDILVNAFKLYKEKYQGEWNLICIGNGELNSLVKNIDGIEYLQFLDQQQILEKMKNASTYIMPSRFDPSPLVVHEAASAGIPLILSKSIGNRLLFLIDGFNGYSYDTESYEQLAYKMNLMTKKTAIGLGEFSENSRSLSSQHKAKFVAASLMSVLLINENFTL